MKPAGSCSSTICLKAQIFIWTRQFDFSPWLHLTAPSNNTRTLKFKAQPDKCIFRRRQSSVWRLLPASDYCRTLVRSLNRAQRFDYHVLDSGGKLGGATEHLIDCRAKNALSFKVCMLLKGAVRKNGAYFAVLLTLAFNWLQISAIGKTVLGYCLLKTLRYLAISWTPVEIWQKYRFSSSVTYWKSRRNIK